MIAIIVASHGLFAQEAVASVEMITGQKIENCGVVSIVEGKSYEEGLAEINELYNTLDRSNGVLIFTDIYGGTPANVATYLAITNSDVVVYSGFNLPTLLEIMYQRTEPIEKIKSTIESTYKDALVCISDRLKKE